MMKTSELKSENYHETCHVMYLARSATLFLVIQIAVLKM